jgi:choline dehydrogenase-like flavoprotein
VPVKFSLDGDPGMDIMEAGYPKSQEIACDSLDPQETEEKTVSASGLSYDENTDQYTYVWKTKKDWAGSCRRLIVKLNDGTEHIAYFQFK